MEDQAEQFFSEVHPDLYPGLLSWKLKNENQFPKRMFASSLVTCLEARNFWTLIDSRNEKAKDNKLPNGFANYLRKLHSCPASSGGIERIFSAFGLIWSNIRNRLGTDKAQKLVRIYRHYRA